MCVCICTIFVPAAHGGQKRVMDLLKLEIQFLEPDPLSVRAAHMLNCVSLCAGGASETYPFNIFTALTFQRGLA